jgi:hypothetical protein
MHPLKAFFLAQQRSLFLHKKFLGPWFGFGWVSDFIWERRYLPDGVGRIPLMCMVLFC